MHENMKKQTSTYSYNTEFQAQHVECDEGVDAHVCDTTWKRTQYDNILGEDG